jgi:hypothetical protein
MSDLLPFDLADVIHAELDKMRRNPDGMLHPSTHLNNPLRHAMLDMAGAPTKRNSLVSEVTLMTGTMWHDWIGHVLKTLGLPVMQEVNLTPWLPEGWSGTADLIVWNPEHKAWVLVDIKTTKGESIVWIAKKGAKDDHILQTSSYWWALRNMGLPLVKKVAIFYLPKNDTRGPDPVEPLLVDFEPMPQKALSDIMKGRGAAITTYLESLPDRAPESDEDYGYWLTDELVDPAPREQKLSFNRTSGQLDLKLVPHWSSMYCPYPDELCPCSTLGTEKIGAYDAGGEYHPRKGYEHVEPEIVPE